jgi:hypothetical protein
MMTIEARNLYRRTRHTLETARLFATFASLLTAEDARRPQILEYVCERLLEADAWRASARAERGRS